MNYKDMFNLQKRNFLRPKTDPVIFKLSNIEHKIKLSSFCIAGGLAIFIAFCVATILGMMPFDFLVWPTTFISLSYFANKSLKFAQSFIQYRLCKNLIEKYNQPIHLISFFEKFEKYIKFDNPHVISNMKSKFLSQLNRKEKTQKKISNQEKKENFILLLPYLEMMYDIEDLEIDMPNVNLTPCDTIDNTQDTTSERILVDLHEEPEIEKTEISLHTSNVTTVHKKYLYQK